MIAISWQINVPYLILLIVLGAIYIKFFRKRKLDKDSKIYFLHITRLGDNFEFNLPKEGVTFENDGTNLVIRFDEGTRSGVKYSLGGGGPPTILPKIEKLTIPMRSQP